MSQKLTPQTLRRLTYFAAIADAGSIREAARRMNLSVASVSEALAALEDEVGTTLAVRSTRRFQLTEEGRRVQRIAYSVLDAGELLFANRSSPAEISGQVAVTAPVEIAQSWLPERLERFKRAHPKVGVLVSASDHMVDLSRSKFDIALRARYIPPGDQVTDTHAIALSCVSSAPLALSPREYGWFVPATLIVHTPGDSLDVVDPKSGEKHMIRFTETMAVDNKHVSLAMVASNMGAALVSKSSLKTFPMLCENLPDFDFGHIGLATEMRDTRPSLAALALQSAILDT